MIIPLDEIPGKLKHLPQDYYAINSSAVLALIAAYNFNLDLDQVNKRYDQDTSDMIHNLQSSYGFKPNQAEPLTGDIKRLIRLINQARSRGSRIVIDYSKNRVSIIGKGKPESYSIFKNDPYEVKLVSPSYIPESEPGTKFKWNTGMIKDESIPADLFLSFFIDQNRVKDFIVMRIGADHFSNVLEHENYYVVYKRNKHAVYIPVLAIHKRNQTYHRLV